MTTTVPIYDADGDVVLTMHCAAFTFATEQHSNTAWEQLAKGHDTHGGFWRFCSEDRADWYVVFVSELEDRTIRAARRLARAGGEQYDLADDMARTLAAKRLQHVLGGGGRLTRRSPTGYYMDRAGREYPVVRGQG